MPKYKLIYFNSKGAAEVTRILFCLADQEFEDVRVAREDWPALKPRFVGGTPLEEAEIDSFIYLSEDIQKPYRDVFHCQGDDAEKERLLDIAKTKTKDFMAFFEKKLGSNDFLVGSKISMADVQLMNLMDFLQDRYPDLASQFSLAKAHYNRIAEIPNVKKWLSERPKTEF